MKFNKLIKTILLCGVSASFLTAVPGYACTMLLVGKKASADGSIIVSRNEDLENKHGKQLEYIEPVFKKAGETLKSRDGKIVITFDKDTPLYGYSAMPDDPALNDGNLVFGEHGVNSQGIVMSSTVSLAAHHKVDSTEEGKLTEENVFHLILPQIKSAREGVELLGEYVEQYGDGDDGNAYAFADDNEVWYFETGSAHTWLAIKIPEDAYFIGANEHRLHDVNLADENVLSSKGLFEFVQENNLLEGQDLDRKHFNFAKAFGEIGSMGNQSRIFLAQNMLNGSDIDLADESVAKQAALFLKPTEKITVDKVKEVMAATYKDTQYSGGDVLEHKFNGKKVLNIGRDTTMETHIIQVRKDMPQEFKVKTWLALGASRNTVYMPVYFGAIKKFPEPYQTPQAYEQFWEFANQSVKKEEGQFKIQPNYLAAQQAKAKFEKDIAKQSYQLDAKLRQLYINNRDAAIQAASSFSTESLNAGLKMVSDFNKLHK